MTVVKINAIAIPEGAGAELEKRFAARKRAVEGFDGFVSFQLLRPVRGEDRYFVVTEWESEEAFRAWADQRGTHGDADKPKPVATGAELLEFEVVESVRRG